MLKIKTLLGIAAAGLIASVVSASASSLSFADSVISFNQGVCTTSVSQGGPGCLAARSDPNNALGVADGDFVSLGLGGDITLGFSTGPFAGGTATIYEITFNRNNEHDEAASVYSILGGLETFVGTITNALGSNSVLVAGAFDSIKLVDVTEIIFPLSTIFDGFDLDAIAVQPVPLPAAGLLLLAGLGGMTLVARRRRNAA